VLRSTSRRQSDSARSYLDFNSLSPALDSAAQLTAKTLGYPIAMINIIDRDSQYTLAQHGLPAKAGAVVPRSLSVCAHTVDARQIVAVDARSPGRSVFAENSSIWASMHEAGLSAYRGIPILGREGMAIGTLSVVDPEPRRGTDTDGTDHLLTLLAGTVQELLDAHRDRAHPPLDPAAAAEFAAAIADGEITAWYQPIVDLDSGRMVAVEALARWDHPTRGLLTPEQFVERAEASELIIDLDLAVLTRGLRDLSIWLSVDGALGLHVNVSGVHFAHPDCVERLISTVLEAGCSPKSVVVEITESVSFAASPTNSRFVADLRAAGFQVVLDDLGAGWSGLERLLELPFSGFKVDKAVTERLGARSGDAVMRSLHSLASVLGLDFIVEGVETVEQAQVVAGLGSVRGQGYWWSRPAPASKITDMLWRDTAADDRITRTERSSTAD
jgi:EAL domain-containing protein (putative c-di-GMP-specific phosphodiesterase class I)